MTPLVSEIRAGIYGPASGRVWYDVFWPTRNWCWSQTIEKLFSSVPNRGLILSLTEMKDLGVGRRP